MLKFQARSGLISEEMERILIGADAVTDTPSLLEWIGAGLRAALPRRTLILALCPSESREWDLHSYPSRGQSRWGGDHPIQHAIRELAEAGPHCLGACLPDEFGGSVVWAQPLRSPKEELLGTLLLAGGANEEIDSRARDWLVSTGCLTTLLVGRIAKLARLARLEREVEELENMKSGFMDTISHELKTPLTSIIGFASLALSQPGIDKAPPLPEFLGSIHEAGLQLERLINEVLVMSDMASAEHSIELEEYYLGDLLLEFRDTYLPRLDAEGRVDFAQDLGPTQVRVDRYQFLRTLEHLVSNALKFSPAGSIVDIGWSFIEGRRHGDESDFLKIDVQDRGIGISVNEAERVFDKFYQVDSSSTRENGGTGLGLALAKEFIEAMGGKLWVESELGRGSTFSFTVAIPRD